MPPITQRVIRTALYLTLPLLCLSANAQNNSWVESYDVLLEKYVKTDGVDYKSWHASTSDRQTLRNVVEAIGTTDIGKLDAEEQLVFYLNAYNAWILHVVIDAYPIKSIKKAKFLVFKRQHIIVAGKKTSFYALENDVIRKKFKEPRIHFALNCASRACPPLQARAFRTKALEDDLQNLAKAFINKNPFGVTRKENRLYLSKIFDWYAADFGGESGLIKYINGLRIDKIPGGTPVRFMDYDWSLNASK